MTVTGETFAHLDWYAEDLGAAQYRDCVFRDVDLTEAVTSGAEFHDCLFDGCRLNASRHDASSFVLCRFRRTPFFDATFEGCRLTGSSFVECTLRPLTARGGVDLTTARLRETRLDLAGAVAVAEAHGARVEPT